MQMGTNTVPSNASAQKAACHLHRQHDQPPLGFQPASHFLAYVINCSGAGTKPDTPDQNGVIFTVV